LSHTHKTLEAAMFRGFSFFLALTDKRRESKETLEALNLENYQKQTFSM